MQRNKVEWNSTINTQSKVHRQVKHVVVPEKKFAAKVHDPYAPTCKPVALSPFLLRVSVVGVVFSDFTVC